MRGAQRHVPFGHAPGTRGASCLSVVTPCFDEASTGGGGEAGAGVAWTAELIVVDDGSTVRLLLGVLAVAGLVMVLLALRRPVASWDGFAFWS